MNKKGFTLIEMLAVIVVLGILMTIIVPSVFNIVSNSKNKAYTNVVGMIENGAKLYVTENREEVLDVINNSGNYRITLEELINLGLVKGPILDPRSDTNIDLSKMVTITKDVNNILYYCFEEDTECAIPNIPIITMIGNSTININAGTAYVDAGATAIDNIEGDITGRIIVANTVNTYIAGTYTVTYNVTNTRGVAAEPVVRTVHVSDSGVPIITILGTNPITHPVGSAYIDAGATASDSIDGDITSSIHVTSTVNPNLLGDYTVIYTVNDSAGNNALPATRTVQVRDMTAPVISVVGNLDVTINAGNPYVDAGATATDNIDGNITNRIQTTNNVNVNAVGNYTVTYTVSDTAGNAAIPAVRTVHVVDGSSPSIVCNPNGNPTYAQSRSTIVTVTDDSGVNASSLKYQWTTSTSAPTEASFNSSGTAFTSGGSISSRVGVTGTEYLWLIAKDVINNTTITSCAGFNIDNTNPTVSFAPNGNGTYAQSRTTTVTVSDAHSGVNGGILKYQWTTSADTPTEASFSTLGTSFVNGSTIATPVGETGTYYLWILAKDNANNTSIIGSSGFNIDNTIPTVSFSMNGNSTYAQSRSTTATVSDAHSGINEGTFKYIWNTSTTAPAEASFSNTFTNGASLSPGAVSGGYYLWILAKDTANNTLITRSNVFNMDNTDPTCSTSGGSSTWYNTSRTITINCSDAQSGVDSCHGVAGTSRTQTYTSNTNGWWTYNVSDNAGNSNTCQAQVRIDKTAPAAPSLTVINPTYFNAACGADTGGSGINSSNCIRWCNNSSGSSCTPNITGPNGQDIPGGLGDMSCARTVDVAGNQSSSTCRTHLN